MSKRVTRIKGVRNSHMIVGDNNEMRTESKPSAPDAGMATWQKVGILAGVVGAAAAVVALFLT